jgi:hypothetical protein
VKFKSIEGGENCSEGILLIYNHYPNNWAVFENFAFGVIVNLLMKRLPEMRKLKQKVKRHIDIYFFPKRVTSQLQLRQGECRQCGKCCKLLFRCPMLVGKNPPYKCLIYSNRSKVCKQFPICREDLEDVNYQCGYSFR